MRNIARWKILAVLEVVEIMICPRGPLRPRRLLIPAMSHGTMFNIITAETAKGSTWYGSASSRLGNHRQPPSASMGSEAIVSWTFEYVEAIRSPASFDCAVAVADAGVVVILSFIVWEPNKRRPRTPCCPPHILHRTCMLLTNTGRDNSPDQNTPRLLCPKFA